MNNKIVNSNLIPDWVTNDIQLWSEGKINDSKLIDIINYLIENKIILIDNNSLGISEVEKITSWIQIITSWWIDDQIDDESFFKCLEFLIQKQIISI